MRLLSIDPGMETGVAVFSANSRERARRIGMAQREGGLQGLKEGGWLASYISAADVIVCEKFSPRPGARSWKLDELEPIRIEGWLESFGREIIWRKPEQRKLIRTLPQTERFMQWAGYWATPKMVNRPDANDANAAAMHAIGALRDRAHFPTIEMLIEYGDLHMEESD